MASTKANDYRIEIFIDDSIRLHNFSGKKGFISFLSRKLHKENFFPAYLITVHKHLIQLNLNRLVCDLNNQAGARAYASSILMNNNKKKFFF